jgi:Mg-chelatase subunit ChlD
LTLETADFVFGDSTRSEDGKWQFQAGASPTNSVQVNARRTAASPDGPIDLFFSGLMGGGGFEYATSAVASFTNADICLVLDRSSSMKLAMDSSATSIGAANPRFCDVPWPDSRWAALASAIEVFVNKMGTTDADEKVAVVTFSSYFTACSNTTPATTLNQPLTADLSLVTAAMTTLSNAIWNGHTETSVGMALARNELTNNGRTTTRKVMIVLTDGAYTNYIHPSGEAALAASQGIRVHTITFGNTPQSVINNMIETAEAGGGQHFHAPDPATLNNVFGELGGSFSILTE